VVHSYGAPRTSVAHSIEGVGRCSTEQSVRRLAVLIRKGRSYSVFDYIGKAAGIPIDVALSVGTSAVV
jgi:hypothetical protein